MRALGEQRPPKLPGALGGGMWVPDGALGGPPPALRRRRPGFTIAPFPWCLPRPGIVLEAHTHDLIYSMQ